MSHRTWTLIDPVAPVAHQRASLAGELSRGIRSLGFLSNRKPNTAELQRTLANRISARYPKLRIAFFEKESSAAGAGEDIINSVMQEVELLVNGTGD